MSADKFVARIKRQNKIIAIAVIGLLAGLIIGLHIMDSRVRSSFEMREIEKYVLGDQRISEFYGKVSSATLDAYEYSFRNGSRQGCFQFAVKGENRNGVHRICWEKSDSLPIKVLSQDSVEQADFSRIMDDIKTLFSDKEKKSSVSIPEDIIILPGDDVFWISSNPKPAKVRNTVGGKELIFVDSIINKLIDSLSHRKACEPASFYRKQYQFLEDGESKLAYINLFPKFNPEKDREDSFRNWKSSLVRAMDGETHFCSIEFDISSQRARLFQCNGPG